MNTMQPFFVLGGGWLSGLGHGFWGSVPQFTADGSDFHYPELPEYIGELPSRFGRFDGYTRVCFSAAALALYDAGMHLREGKKNVGIVVGSSSGVFDNDLAYLRSTLEAGGAFTSPNLFSYTLSNVALGEIAVYFNFIGPTFCVGNDPASPGSEVLSTALSVMASGQCDAVLAGWTEVSEQSPETLPFKGSAFVVITADKASRFKTEFWVQPNFQFVELFKGKSRHHQGGIK